MSTEKYIRRVCVATERVRRFRTAGRRDRDARPGASPGSGSRMEPRTLGRVGVAHVETKKTKKKKGRRPKDLFGRRPE